MSNLTWHEITAYVHVLADDYGQIHAKVTATPEKCWRYRFAEYISLGAAKRAAEQDPKLRHKIHPEPEYPWDA